nr:MetaGeneMark_Unknown Function [uncultured bacterium]
MRRCQAMVVLFLFLGSGCASPQAGRPSSWLESFRAGKGLLEADVVQLDVALLERPAADKFINGDLWSFTAEQVVALERRTVVDQNGFRVGVLVGMPPGAFQELLTSERSCINPRRRIVPSGKVAGQTLGSPVADCRFTVFQGATPLEFRLQDVQFILDVTAFPTEDGRTRLQFTPKVQYGEVTREIQPAPDRTGFTMQMERPSKSFPDAGWEVTLAPSEFLVIGTREDRPESFGYQAFMQEEASPPVQRLLVIRTARAAGPDEAATPTLEDMARSNSALPLAIQATLSARAMRQ